MTAPQKYLSQTILGLLGSTGQTKTELATALGMERRTLYQRLSNRKSWNLSEIDKIAKFFGYPDGYALMELSASQKNVDNRISLAH